METSTASSAAVSEGYPENTSFHSQRWFCSAIHHSPGFTAKHRRKLQTSFVRCSWVVSGALGHLLRTNFPHPQIFCENQLYSVSSIHPILYVRHPGWLSNSISENRLYNSRTRATDITSSPYIRTFNISSKISGGFSKPEQKFHIHSLFKILITNFVISIQTVHSKIKQNSSVLAKLVKTSLLLCTIQTCTLPTCRWQYLVLLVSLLVRPRTVFWAITPYSPTFRRTRRFIFRVEM
jgi:hypothetical protein